MPVAVSYPGVYIEEIPSGVRTITGVSTSVTAFVGSAKRGPVNNEAVHILSYIDYERRFGGLATDSEMSYAVRQFFLNGGSEAWVVRLGKGASAASHTLKNSAQLEVLTITALDKGAAGSNIEVWVDYQTDNPASTFNLTFNYTAADNPGDKRTEKFTNLSMNSQDARDVGAIVNGASELVEIKVHPNKVTKPGASVSGALQNDGGELLDVAELLDDTHNQFQVVVNGLSPVTVNIDPRADVTGDTPQQRLTNLCSAIQRKVRAAASGRQALRDFTCAPTDGSHIALTSGEGGEASSVRVLPGLRNDAAGRLKLGTLNGGIETDAVAVLRPDEIPNHGTLTSGVFGPHDLDNIPDATHNSLQISLDGYGPDPILLESQPTFQGNDLGYPLKPGRLSSKRKVRSTHHTPACLWCVERTLQNCPALSG